MSAGIWQSVPDDVLPTAEPKRIAGSPKRAAAAGERLTVYLPSDLYDQARALAFEDHTSLSHVVTEAMRLLVESKGQRRLPIPRTPLPPVLRWAPGGSGAAPAVTGAVVPVPIAEGPQMKCSDSTTTNKATVPHGGQGFNRSNREAL